MTTRTRTKRHFDLPHDPRDPVGELIGVLHEVDRRLHIARTTLARLIPLRAALEERIDRELTQQLRITAPPDPPDDDHDE